ncbi:IS21 family transposase [Jonesiaceae bacterium BS-20]|uniref:IS21 family transposase n=1 Tax=Jonesiaceae bacterium BS-20 TaxID=3120821 RepID=A0AAU7DWS5_9MICO
MADYQAIMSLVLKGRTYDEITASVGCSRRDVAAVKQKIGSDSITVDRFASMTGQEIEDLFPDGRRTVSQDYADPHFVQVVEEMKHNRFFTLQQGWVKYVGGSSTKKKYSYSQYCERFNRYAAAVDVVATLTHEPGKTLLVDWVGPTLPVVDTVSGEVFKAYLFVASLPYSGLVFCQAFRNMKQHAWNQAHVNALNFIGGVPQIIVPDNARTATHERGRGDKEVLVTKVYRQLAQHYGTAIVPTRYKKPRDKAHVERMVHTVETQIIGYLNSLTWTSFEELNDAIAERLTEINEHRRRVNKTTRKEVFDAEEVAFLAPLPDQPFESVEYKQLKVGRNYHVSCLYQYYSVPYQLAGKILSVRVTTTTVSIFDGQVKVAEHVRVEGRRGQYSTVLAHAPKHHQQIDGLWSREWFVNRARNYGPATVEVITQILDRTKIEAQAYLACRNILTELGRKKGVLEETCQEMISFNGHPTYTSLKRVMATIVEAKKHAGPAVAAADNVKDLTKIQDLSGAFVRDPSHYQVRGL